MKNIVAVAFPKGGTGKSTVSANLAAEAARRGLRPLLIDLDPQGSSSLLSGFDKYEIEWERSSGAMFQDEPIPPSALASKTKFGYDIVPACGSMVPAEAWLNRATLAVPRLRRLFARDTEMHEKYDFIVVDTIGSKQTKLLEATLLACSDVVIPLRASVLSTDELPDFLDLIKVIDEHREGAGGARMNLCGLVLNAVKMNTRSYADHSEEIARAKAEMRDAYGYEKVTTFAIPDAIAIEEAASSRAPVLSVRPKSPVAMRYNELFTALFPKIKSRV